MGVRRAAAVASRGGGGASGCGRSLCSSGHRSTPRRRRRSASMLRAWVRSGGSLWWTRQTQPPGSGGNVSSGHPFATKTVSFAPARCLAVRESRRRPERSRTGRSGRDIARAAIALDPSASRQATASWCAFSALPQSLYLAPTPSSLEHNGICSAEVVMLEARAGLERRFPYDETTIAGARGSGAHA